MRWIEEIDLPQRRAKVIVGIECIDAVMLSGDKDNIVYPISRDSHSRQIKRLSINLAVDRITEELAKLAGTHAGRSQLRFIQILASSRQIVVIGNDTDVAIPQQGAQENGVGVWHP